MTEPRWLDEHEARMWRSYLEMHRRLAAKIDRELVKDGLSAADYALLAPLSEASNRELRARDLGKMADWDRSRLSHHIRRMEDRGLIERRECEMDARGTMIRITDAGLEALRRAAPRHVETVREYLVDLLTPQEREVLNTIAKKVIDQLATPCDSAGDETCQAVMDPAERAEPVEP